MNPHHSTTVQTRSNTKGGVQTLWTLSHTHSNMHTKTHFLSQICTDTDRHIHTHVHRKTQHCPTHAHRRITISHASSTDTHRHTQTHTDTLSHTRVYRHTQMHSLICMDTHNTPTHMCTDIQTHTFEFSPQHVHRHTHPLRVSPLSHTHVHIPSYPI